ncbi:hypothetical protein ACCO45_009148 [Purpureocillium lilacinum]|uniref:Uncharacterized protein n=1 Tax=Purpureocillium lilacinum TaxID=33203 RepID=A0ACC4DIU8_PURLI
MPTRLTERGVSNAGLRSPGSEAENAGRDGGRPTKTPSDDDCDGRRRREAGTQRRPAAKSQPRLVLDSVDNGRWRTGRESVVPEVARKLGLLDSWLWLGRSTAGWVGSDGAVWLFWVLRARTECRRERSKDESPSESGDNELRRGADAEERRRVDADDGEQGNVSNKRAVRVNDDWTSSFEKGKSQ